MKFTEAINQIDRNRYLDNIESWCCLAFFFLFQRQECLPIYSRYCTQHRIGSILPRVAWQTNEFIRYISSSMCEELLTRTCFEMPVSWQGLPQHDKHPGKAMIITLEFSGQLLEAVRKSLPVLGLVNCF